MLHRRATLSRAAAEQREGFFMTTPLRTLLDVAGAKTVTDEQLSRAVDDALERGLVRKSKLEAAVRKIPGASRLLRPLAAERGADINSLRLKLVIEPLLARLFASPNPPWILKGG